MSGLSDLAKEGKSASATAMLAFQGKSADSKSKIDILGKVTVEPDHAVDAKRSVIVVDNPKVPVTHNAEHIIIHRSKEPQVRVDVSQSSNYKGEFLPPAWDNIGNLSEVHLMKGGNFSCLTSTSDDMMRKDLTICCKSKTTVELNDKEDLTTEMTEANKPDAFVASLSEADLEIRRLHASHVTKDSQQVDLEAVIRSFCGDQQVLSTLRCKALVNAPSSGSDVVGEGVLVMTRAMLAGTDKFVRNIYFFQASDLKEIEGEMMEYSEDSDARRAFCCGLLKSQTVIKKTKDDHKMQLNMQTSIFVDNLSVENQLLQIFYEQIDGTRIAKSRLTETDLEKDSENSCCSCCRLCCSCFSCCKCSCSCLPTCCNYYMFTKKASSKDCSYDIKIRTHKTLDALVKQESSIKSQDKIPDGKEQLETSTVCTNLAALHVRFFDPVSNSYKETVAIVSPKESLHAVCNFVALAALPPNQLSDPRRDVNLRSTDDISDLRNVATVISAPARTKKSIFSALDMTSWSWLSNFKGSVSRSLSVKASSTA